MSFQRFQKSAAACLIACLGLTATAACGGGDGASSKGNLETVNLTLDWTWGSEHAAWIVAEEKGFFKDEGLKVNIREGAGSSVTGTLLGSGKTDIGVMSAMQVIKSVAAGLPVTAVDLPLANEGTAVIYNKDKMSFSKLTDLYGHTVGQQQTSTVYTEWKALAKINNLDVSKIHEVDVGQSAVTALVSGKVDAVIGLPYNQGMQARTEGANVGWVKFDKFGLDVPLESIAVNNAFMDKHENAVRGFVKAANRAFRYIKEHPKDALNIMYKAHPDLKTAYQTDKFPLVLNLIDLDTLGTMPAAKWQNTYDALVQTGAVTDKNMKLEGNVYTTKFLGSGTH